MHRILVILIGLIGLAWIIPAALAEPKVDSVPEIDWEALGEKSTPILDDGGMGRMLKHGKGITQKNLLAAIPATSKDDGSRRIKQIWRANDRAGFNNFLPVGKNAQRLLEVVETKRELPLSEAELLMAKMGYLMQGVQSLEKDDESRQEAIEAFAGLLLILKKDCQEDMLFDLVYSIDDRISRRRLFKGMLRSSCLPSMPAGVRALLEARNPRQVVGFHAAGNATVSATMTRTVLLNAYYDPKVTAINKLFILGSPLGSLIVASELYECGKVEKGRLSIQEAISDEHLRDLRPALMLIQNSNATAARKSTALFLAAVRAGCIGSLQTFKTKEAFDEHFSAVSRYTGGDLLEVVRIAYESQLEVDSLIGALGRKMVPKHLHELIPEAIVLRGTMRDKVHIANWETAIAEARKSDACTAFVVLAKLSSTSAITQASVMRELKAVSD